MVEQVMKYSDGTETVIKYKKSMDENETVVEETTPVEETETVEETVETPEVVEETPAESVEETA